MVDECSLTASFEFLGLLFKERVVIEKALELAQMYTDVINVEEMANEFLAFIYASDLPNGTQPSLLLLSAFEERVLRKMEQRKQNSIMSVSELVNVKKEPKVELTDEEEEEDLMIGCYGIDSTPVAQKRKEQREMKKEQVLNSPFQKSETPSYKKYEKRDNRGQVLLAFGIFNDNDDTSSSKLDNKEKEENAFKVVQCLSKAYAYMFEPLLERAGVLDDHITNLAQKLLKCNGNVDEEIVFNNVNGLTTEASWYAGMIVKNNNDDEETNVEGNKLNKSNVALLGSLETSDGAVCPLDLSLLNDVEVDLFPGQVVVMKATNPSGKTLIPQLVMTEAMPPLAPLSTTETLTGLKKGVTSVVLASGPYTTRDNLSYAPLQDLLDLLSKNRADVVILMGPFLDEQQLTTNEELEVHQSYEELFNEIVSTISQTLLPFVSQLVLVPSASRDVHHDFVYPSPPFSIGAHKDLVLISDPSVIEINGISIGLTSVDPLFHLSKEALLLNRSDRMTRVAKLLLSQQSFYPLYPPNENVNIDYEKWEHYCHFRDTRPHLLVMPSDLQHFVREVKGTVVINPGRLAKKEGGGVYMRVAIANHSENKDDGNAVMNRIRGEIVRI